MDNAKEIERIEDQLRRAFEGEAWHGLSVYELLAEVTAEMAAAKPIANAHRIWEIGLHIPAWENAVRRRLEGEAVDLSAEADWPKVHEMSDAAWKKTLEALEKSNTQLRETISRFTDSHLENKVAGQNHTVYFTLHGMIQHDLDYAGQIAVLKKVWT
ncbi:MAG: DinB family protein [candidate division KSB1 bacterium]|nr:DinB family protein [candidate division KSB1 bacterium]